MTETVARIDGTGEGGTVHRHRLSTRVWHWANAALLLVMLMSGLMIFNAHPRLYWGAYGANPDPAWLEIGSADGRGYVRVGGATFDTSGVLGTQAVDGRVQRRAFPGWATIPSTYDLALSRRWHLTFAWPFAAGLVLYGVWSLANGHVRRDLLPRGRELGVRHLLGEVRSHLTLGFRGGGGGAYNSLQKLAYCAVLGVLLPVMVLSGLAMSPAMDAAWPWLVDLFGGRQSARSVHFIAAALLVLFVVVHLVMVVLAGPWKGVRAMITGRWRGPGG
jgi:thiosulfate reductase cytochrome b subunit